MRILRSRILACPLRSHSTCPCAGHRRPSHCTPLQSAWHSSCSSRSRPGRSSPLGHSEAFVDTCRATGRTAASRQQTVQVEEPAAAHCSEPCWSTGWGEGQSLVGSKRSFTVYMAGLVTGQSVFPIDLKEAKLCVKLWTYLHHLVIENDEATKKPVWKAMAFVSLVFAVTMTLGIDINCDKLMHMQSS